MNRQGRISLKPCKNERMPGGNAMLPHTALTLSILKDRNGKWKHGHSETELNNYVDLDVKKEGFFENFSVKIPSNGRVFDLHREIDHFQWKVVSAYTDLVAPSLSEVRRGHKFYIHDESEEAKVLNIKTKLKHKCYDILYKMTNTERINYVTLYGYNVGSTNAEVAEAIIIKEIEKAPEKFLKFKENESRTNDLIDLLQLVEYRIVNKNGQNFYYGDVLLGVNETEALRMLSDVKQQRLKIQLKELLRIAKGGAPLEEEPVKAKMEK